jgi:hypothetical protein
VHFITVLETATDELPLLHAMEERAGETRSQAIEPEDAVLAVASILRSPSRHGANTWVTTWA